MPSRNQRAKIARETLEILESGTYETPAGQTVDIGPQLAYAVKNTRLYAPHQFPEVFAVRDEKLGGTSGAGGIELKVLGATTLAAARRLVEESQVADVLCLNFASAKNPGGGFLSGSQAQEESLARASGLYAAIHPQQTMYETNRRYRSCLYTDHLIYSPQVPVFRDDDDRLLESPFRVSMLTVPAVNAGAVREQEPENVSRIQETMLRRMEKLLSVAVVHGHGTLVLGAWGCGVFKNDPAQVASWFRYHLVENDTFRSAFETVWFAVPDDGTAGSTYQIFRDAFE
jgi:uncharacterized protein (TIGR02452 family)